MSCISEVLQQMSTETCEARVLIIFDWGYSDLSSIQPRNSERLGPTTDPWTSYWQHYFDKFSCPCSNFIWALQAWKTHELVIFCIEVTCFKPRFSWGTASGSAQWLSYKLLVVTIFPQIFLALILIHFGLSLFWLFEILFGSIPLALGLNSRPSVEFWIRLPLS